MKIRFRLGTLILMNFTLGVIVWLNIKDAVNLQAPIRTLGWPMTIWNNRHGFKRIDEIYKREGIFADETGHGCRPGADPNYVDSPQYHEDRLNLPNIFDEIIKDNAIAEQRFKALTVDALLALTILLVVYGVASLIFPVCSGPVCSGSAGGPAQ